MKIEINLEIDIEIPVHVYNEAVELFLNHVKEHYAMRLLTDDDLSPIFETPSPSGIPDIIHFQSLSLLGKTCPIYDKKSKADDNVPIVV